MKPKFDIKEFEKLKKDEIIFECESCGKDFQSTKKYVRRSLGITKHPRKPSLKYCSRVCQTDGKMTGEYFNCVNCGESVYRSIREIRKSENCNFFCNRSCSGTHSNKSKNFGCNRSKMEIWIENEITNKYKFNIIFNDREVLDGYELDIYIPELKIAFELNGIFHYEPIFGDKQLKITTDKDLIKIKKCKLKKIDLFVIDTTDSKRFDEKKDTKYLEFINSKINEYKKGDLAEMV